MTATTLKCVGCDSHYSCCKCARPYAGAALNALPTRILDVLETDGGWLATDSIVDALNAKPESVKKAIFRLRDRDLVEARTSMVYGASEATNWPDRRTEWRLTT